MRSRGAASLSDADRQRLARAWKLAERGRPAARPNPLVGCVLVRDGAVVGEGFHAVFGGPHAEVEALAAAGEAARGATAYVSLEPCAHSGKTGPCTEALRTAGVARVVFGARDPGPGAGGADRLHEAGIEVVGPVWDDDRAAAQNPAFFHVHRHRTPFVTLKLAMSLDGRIAARPGQRTRITGPEATSWVHDLRREFDAILVGSGTVAVDDPLLTVRHGAPPARPPARVVLDSSLRIVPEAALFDDADRVPVHVFHADGVDPQRREAVRAAGASLRPVRRGDGGLSLDGVFEDLWEIGLRSILCEGGGTLGSALMNEDRVQRLHLLMAPIVLGPAGVPAFPGVGSGPGWTPSTPLLTFGRDVLLTYSRAPRTVS